MDNTEILKWNQRSKSQKHHFFLPSPSLRALIIGSSNCGKTCLLLKLLLTEKWLDYNDLYIYSNSLHQPEYKLMKIAFRKGYDKGDIRNFLANSNEDIDKFLKTLPQKFYKPVINSRMFDSSEIIPDPRDFNPKRKSLFIFDDIMTEKNQDPASNFYTRGRHNNCSCIYISQNYHKLPRQTIRTNSNLLILFSIPKKDLRHIYEDIISNDMPWDEFNSFCKDVFNTKYSFVSINKDATIDEGKICKNLNQIYIPRDFYLKKMIVFTKDTQYNQCKREDILNDQNQKYINSLKHELKTGKGLINTALRYMPEMHLSLPNTVESENIPNGSFQNTGKYSYCGPGTKVKKRVSEGYQGVNKLDNACKEHDIYYSKYKNTQARNVADDILASKASQIALNPNLPDYERKDARLVAGIMGVKSRFGMGIKKKKNTNEEILTNIYYDPKTGYSGIDSIARKSGIKRSEGVKWLTQQNVYSLHKPKRHRFKKEEL